MYLHKLIAVIASQPAAMRRWCEDQRNATEQRRSSWDVWSPDSQLRWWMARIKQRNRNWLQSLSLLSLLVVYSAISEDRHQQDCRGWCSESTYTEVKPLEQRESKERMVHGVVKDRHPRISWFFFIINDNNNNTLWFFNIAMENGPFIDGLPIKNGDVPWLC